MLFKKKNPPPAGNCGASERTLNRAQESIATHFTRMDSELVHDPTWKERKLLYTYKLLRIFL